MRYKNSTLSAVVVTLFLAASLVPLVLYAADLSADTSIDGTDLAGYTKITNVQELSNIQNDPNGEYYLANDIVFSSNGSFTPIGTDVAPFTGIFDGNGHVIKGMNAASVQLSVSAYSGLFGCVGNGGQVKNVGVVGGSAGSTQMFTSIGYVGGIAGLLQSGASITNCYNTGSVTALSQYSVCAGGIAGLLQSGASMTGCYNTGSVTAKTLSNPYAYAGGIVGNTSSPITGCYNTGSVTSTSGYSSVYAGGIAGQATSSIAGCYSSGEVTATTSSGVQSDRSYAGGIVGNTSSSVTQCYNTGSVSSATSYSNAYVGGIAGNASLSITICYNTGSVSATSKLGEYIYVGGIVGYTQSPIADCYNTGSVLGSLLWARVGGIVGETSSSIANCYSIGSVSTDQSDMRPGGIAGRSTSSVVNCYYLTGKQKFGGYVVPPDDERLVASGAPVVDGGDASVTTPERTTEKPDQRSSTAKTASEMRPTLPSAEIGNSVYFTGTTTPAGGSPMDGWDFDGTWTITTGVNNGYPTLKTISMMSDKPDSGQNDTYNIVIMAIAGIAVLGVAWFFGRKI